MVRFDNTDEGRNSSGKPWVTTNAYSALPTDIQNKFYFRDTLWPSWTQTDFPNGLPWMSFEGTQRVHNGIISVSVAQHLSGHMSDSVQFADMYHANRGRGYDYTTGKNSADRVWVVTRKAGLSL